MDTPDPTRGNARVQQKLLRTLEQLLDIQATELRPALEAAGHHLAEALNADKIDIFLYDPTKDSLVALGTSNTPMAHVQKALGLDIVQCANGGSTVDVFQTGLPYTSTQADQDARVLRGVREGLGVRSLIEVPLVVQGERRGVLNADWAKPNAFCADDVHFLQAVARWVGMIVQRAELVAHLTRAATEQAQRGTAQELVTVVAHDLSNALTPLTGRLHLLRRRAEREGRLPDVAEAEAALQAVQRLQFLMRDLLDVARLEHGLFTLNREQLDLCTLVQETVRALQSEATPVELRAGGALHIEGDALRLRQALENLLSNAFKHAPAGVPVRVEVRSETRADGAWAVLSVCDQGPGIPAELQSRLFTRFVSGSESGGLGLGLYLAHGIATAHGGTLTVESQVGAGATFQFAVALAEPAAVK